MLRPRLVPLVVAVAVATGCHSDRLQDARTVPAPPRLSLQAVGDDATAPRVRVVLDSAGADLPGSFRLAVHYDTMRHRFIGLDAADSLLLAAHDDAGRVLVAGASLQGFAAGAWATLRFAPRGDDAPAGVGPSPFAMELLEVGATDGTDLRRRILVDPRSAWRP